jgi:methylenetetrahydrofolate reductase (NADPH)
MECTDERAHAQQGGSVPGPPRRGAPVTTAALYTHPLGRPTISFEIFPPRTPAGADKLWETVQRLAAVAPDFISVTYGASGSTRDSSRGLVRRILAETPVTAVAHLTCVRATRDEVADLVAEFLDEGVRDILALRGDPPKDEPDWEPPADGLPYAYHLVRLIREIEHRRCAGRAAPEPLSIAVAAYPGGTASPTRAREVTALLAKQEAGADYAITQLFYDPAAYAGLVHDARAAGVHLPIVPGVIPMTDPGRLQRLAVLTGVEPPAELMARLAATDDPRERHRVGIGATVDLAHAVLDAGAPGLHVYTFNTSHAALDLLEGVHLDGGARRAPDLASGPWVSAPPAPSAAQGQR